MPQQVFVKVVGFTEVERKALDTLFRLSEDRPTSYRWWTPEAEAQPEFVVLDGQRADAQTEAMAPEHQSVRLVWIGDQPPVDAWRSFERPLAWPDVIETIDEHFGPAPTPAAATAVDAEVDFDFDFEVDASGPDTLPPEEVPEDSGPRRRGLIANADLGERLYLRAKLALNELTVADEAETAAQAIELLRERKYTVALVDFGLPGAEGWTFIRQLTRPESGIAHLIVTKDTVSVFERLRAWHAGVALFLDKPLDSEKLQQALQKFE